MESLQDVLQTQIELQSFEWPSEAGTLLQLFRVSWDQRTGRPWLAVAVRKEELLKDFSIDVHRFNGGLAAYSPKIHMHAHPFEDQS